ncbi:hypothetical protein GCM10025792_37260 [Pseudonocardia tropica]|uniref:hypothetical protein n=1 Tax=Pseudonocardia tropica TaxID=681289 RepID=UPI0031EF4069
MRTSVRPDMSRPVAAAFDGEPAAARSSPADAPPPVDASGDGGSGGHPEGGAHPGLLGRMAVAVRAANRAGVPF